MIVLFDLLHFNNDNWILEYSFLNIFEKYIIYIAKG